MKNKIMFISIIISIIAIASIFLYNTYATDPVLSNDNYAITLTGDTTVTIPRFSYKDVIYQIKNTTLGTVRYGIGYTSNNNTTRVKVFNDSTDSETGTISRNNYKYVKLRIENYSDDTETVELSTVLGYENGGNLIPPLGVSLVSDTTDGMYTMNAPTNTAYFYVDTLARANIESIEYVKLSDMPVNQITTNISSDNSVRLWYELNEDTNLYKVYIGTLTGKVKAPSSMYGMFAGLTNITTLDLSVINTSDVTSFELMFINCYKLKKLDMRSFDFSKQSIGSDIFNSAVPENAEIIVKDCQQYNLFVTNFGTKSGLHTVNNDICS